MTDYSDELLLRAEKCSFYCATIFWIRLIKKTAAFSDNLREYFFYFSPLKTGRHLKGTFESKQHLVTSSFQNCLFCYFHC